MDLTPTEIDLLLESLNYSIERVTHSECTPGPARAEKLERLQSLQAKLRRIKRQLSD